MSVEVVMSWVIFVSLAAFTLQAIPMIKKLDKFYSATLMIIVVVFIAVIGSVSLTIYREASKPEIYNQKQTKEAR